MLMSMKNSTVESTELIGRANETLSLIGHVNPPKGRGIRLMAFDGGGTR